MKKLSKDKKSIWLTAYLFLLPAFSLWLIWFCMPMLKSLGLSFYKYNYIMPVDNHFVGLDNYVRLFGDREFLHAVKSSMIIVLVAVPVQTVLALILALVINISFRGRAFFRTLFYAPYVIAPFAVATVFISMFAVGSNMMEWIKAMGFPDASLSTSVKAALPMIIVMFVWQQVGFYMVLFLSGLQTIPNEIMESSKIDGSNGFQTFWYITRPMLTPTTFLVVTYGIISSFQIFDQIAAMAGRGVLGAPGGTLTTLVVYFYLYAFRYGEMGHGSAAVVVLFIIIFTVTLIQKRFMDKDVTV